MSLPKEKMRLSLKACSGFGAGLGGLRLTCGTLLGAALALGILLPYPASLLAVRVLKRRFESYFGSSLCRELVGVFDWHPYAMKKFIKRKRICLEIVDKTATWVNRLRQRPPLWETPPSSPCVIPPILPSWLQQAARVYEGGLAYTGDICGVLIVRIIEIGLHQGGESGIFVPLKNLRAMLKSRSTAFIFRKKVGNFWCKNIKKCWPIF